MATVINNPPSNQAPVTQAAPSSEGWGVGGVLVTLVVIAVLFFLVMVYGLPAMRCNNQSAAPAEPSSGSNVNVDIPDKIDVNVKK